MDSYMAYNGFHSLLVLVSCPPKRGGSRTKLGDYHTLKSHTPCFIITHRVAGPHEYSDNFTLHLKAVTNFKPCMLWPSQSHGHSPQP